MKFALDSVKNGLASLKFALGLHKIFIGPHKNELDFIKICIETS